MKKMCTIKMLLLIFIIVPGYLFSVTYEVDATEMSFNPFFNFYSNNRLSALASGRGYTGIADQGNISLATLNPAAMDLDRTWQIYYEYVNKNGLEYTESNTDLCFDNYKTGFVSAIGLKLNNFQTGVIYYRKDSYDFSYLQPCYYNDNLVDSLDFHLKASIKNITVPIIYTYKNFLKVGLGVQIQSYRSNEPYAMLGQGGISHILHGKVDFTLVRPRFGFVIFPRKNLSFGMFLLPQAKKEIEKDYEEPYADLKFEANTFPAELGAGIKYQPTFIPLSILLDYNYSNDSVYDELLDRHDFNLGLEYSYKNVLTLRTGFFTQMDYRDLDETITVGDEEYDYWSDDVSYDQYFVTFGLSYLWKSLRFDCSVMDSKLISKGDINQRYLNFGCSFNL